MNQFDFVAPPEGSVAAFVCIVAALLLGFVAAVWASGNADEAVDVRARWTRRAALGALALVGLASAGMLSGLFAGSGTPPPIMLFMVASMALAVGLAASRVGARFASGLPVWLLVGFQAFRLPLEMVLHAWYDAGTIPVQMTWSGHNFDVVTGILALVTGALLYARRHDPPVALVLGFNLVGSALLVAVIAIAITSSPIPLRLYDGQPLLLGMVFPYGLIVPVCVGGAIFGHIVTFRWLALRARRGAEVEASAQPAIRAPRA